MAVIDYIKDFLGINFRRTLEDIEESVMQIVHVNLRRIERRIAKSLVSWSIIVLSIIFFALAIIYFLIEYIGLSKSISFFIIAIILLLIGIILKINR